MQHTLLSHLGCTQSPIHVGKSMLRVAELPVGVEGVFLASTVSPQRGWGGFFVRFEQPAGFEQCSRDNVF